MFPQHGLERLFRYALLPDVPDPLLGKPMPQRLRHDTTAGDDFTIRRYSNPFQDRDGELNLKVTPDLGRIDGATAWERLPRGTRPAPAVSLLPPPDERAGDGLTPAVQSLPDAPESVEVDRAGPGEPDVPSQRGTGGYAVGGQPLVCLSFRCVHLRLNRSIVSSTVSGWGAALGVGQ